MILVKSAVKQKNHPISFDFDKKVAAFFICDRLCLYNKNSVIRYFSVSVPVSTIIATIVAKMPIEHSNERKFMIKKIVILIVVLLSYSCEKEITTDIESIDTDLVNNQETTSNTNGNTNEETRSNNSALKPEYNYESSLEMFQWCDALNTEGYHEYEKGNYIEAINLFQQAIIADASYILPHYNLACTYALLYEKGLFTDLDEIRDELQICLVLDATKANRDNDWIYESLNNDSDLDSIRNEDFFSELFDLDRSFTASPNFDIDLLLSGVWKNSMITTITFNEDKTFEMSEEFEYGY